MSLSDNHADMYSSDPCSVPTNMNINYARTIDPNEVDVVWANWSQIVSRKVSYFMKSIFKFKNYRFLL